MFVKTNDRYINLRNVSNINLVKRRNRVVFNLNYSVEINLGDGITKEVSDYAYCDSTSLEEMNEKLSRLFGIPYFTDNFINILGGGYVNKEAVSSIKFIDDRKRVIFNFNHNVEMTKGKEPILSAEFTYVNCSSEEEYDKYKEYVLETLELKNGN